MSITTSFMDEARLDPVILGQLAIDTGSELLPELLALFIADLESRLTTILDLKARDRDWWLAHLHSLKGSCVTYGAMRLSRLAVVLEQQLNSTKVNDSVGVEDSNEVKPSLEIRVIDELILELKLTSKAYQDQLSAIKAAACI